MIYLLLAFCAAAGAYQVLAIVAAIAHLRRREYPSLVQLPVSVLKPVRGRDDGFLRAIRSHALIDYPRFELLFGVRSLEDPAVADIRALQSEYPSLDIRLIECSTVFPNGKVGVLADLAGQARYGLLVLNDSDIVVEPDYLREVTAPLADPDIGLVTCLYRATASSFAGQWEALGIATDFAPSALVAPLVGVKEFGLGSTLALYASDLNAIRGFASIADYIADDYQIGKRISQLGKRVWLSRTVVETHLGAGSWRDVWLHQVRWARTIRLSQGAYLGLPIANGTLWVIAAMVAGLPEVATALLVLRFASGLLTGKLVLGDRQRWLLMPARDLFGFAVWCAAIAGRTVMWRGQKMVLDDQGRIGSIE